MIILKEQAWKVFSRAKLSAHSIFLAADRRDLADWIMDAVWRRCPVADGEHRKSSRQYAHTYHFKHCRERFPPLICVARAFQSLPARNQAGLLLHEFGHLIAGGPQNLDHTERHADIAARYVTGKTILYDDLGVQYVEL